MRIQLDIPALSVERIKRCMSECGFKTYSELFNNSMSVFNWVATEVKQGRIIISQDPSGQTHEKQLSMPFMDALFPVISGEKAERLSEGKSFAASGR